MRVLELVVPEPSQGERLDRFLATAPTDLSRSRLQGLIRAGHVSVNGRAARASLRLRDGDTVRVELPAPEPSQLEPEDLPLAIVHEDEDLIVVDKPAGLVVHPGSGVRSGTLVHALLHRHPEVAVVGGAGRPGIVHRLDKDTSGLMVIARTPRAYLALVEALRARRVSRVYDALVWGSPATASGAIEGAIGRDPRDRKRMTVVRRGGKPARTRFRVEERFGPVSRLRLELESGRTHQIRVHLAAQGLPVVGDPLYGGRPKKQLSLRESERSLAQNLLRSLPRQALHASELSLTHPATGEQLTFRSPWPDDFQQALALLRAFRERESGGSTPCPKP
jgi:23S rRNA pseudouridine1911/1915/1917 synthase